MADWLESYASSLELNVWTSSTVLSASQSASGKWDVVVERPGGSKRIFHVNHLGEIFFLVNLHAHSNL